MKKRTRLIAIGQDDPKPFLLQVKALGLSEQVQILKGRSDIPRFLLGADLLVHPAYNENTGTVLLEALVSGLPVLVSARLRLRPLHRARPKPGGVVPAPFEQEMPQPHAWPRCSPMTRRARELGRQWPGLRRHG